MAGEESTTKAASTDRTPQDVVKEGQVVSPTPAPEKSLVIQPLVIDTLTYDNDQAARARLDSLLAENQRLANSFHDQNTDFQEIMAQIKTNLLWEAAFYHQNIRDVAFPIDSSTIAISQKFYYLDNSNDPVFASAIMQDLLKAAKLQAGAREMINHGGAPIPQIDYFDIKFLESKVQFSLNGGSPIIDSQQLASFARLAKNLEQSGKKIPPSIRLTRNQTAYRTSSQTLDLINSQAIIYSDTINDYVADFLPNSNLGLAAFLITEYPEFYKGYLNVVNQAFARNRFSISQPRLISPVVEGYRLSDSEEFDLAFDSFIRKGVEFRKLLNYTLAKGLFAEYDVLNARYQALKAITGLEYLWNGDARYGGDYQIGDAVLIEDYTAKYQDPQIPLKKIVLREKSTDNPGPGRPYVINGMPIRIVEEWEWNIDEAKKEASRMYRVEKGNLIAEGRAWISSAEPSGFVSEEWFGEKVTFKE